MEDEERSRTEETERSNVIREEEIGRAAAYGRATALLSFIGVVVSSFRHLSIKDRLIVNVPVVLLGLVGFVVWWRSRNASTYSRGLFRVFGVVTGLCALSLILTLGVFTPIVMIVVIGLSFFLNTEDNRFATYISMGFVAAYVTMGGLTAAGVLPDTGIWRTPATQQRIAMTVIVAAVMITQIMVSLSNRKTLHEAVIRAQEAMRKVRTREAQLDEARENLDVALRGPSSGKHTGHSIGGYRLGNTVGRGAMGEVYAARRESDGKRAAIKILHSYDDSIVKRFLREAEIAKKATGPNLIEIFETGVAPDGSPFIAMELLEGKDLAAILRDENQLALMDVVALVDACAKGLDILHRQGVIHRDMKPQNLFLPSSTRKEWKILDYGVSKVIGARTMTQGDIIGTPGYMSPEQAEGKEVDIRTDIFALGAVAYRALTGRRAFSGPDMPAILYQVVHTTPPRAREIVPDLPRRIDVVLSKALAKKKEDRYASAIDFAIAFREASERDDDELPPSEPRGGRQISSPTLTLPGPGQE